MNFFLNLCLDSICTDYKSIFIQLIFSVKKLLKTFIKFTNQKFHLGIRNLKKNSIIKV